MWKNIFFVFLNKRNYKRIIFYVRINKKHQSMASYKIFFKDIFLDTIWEVLYFPFWWYSRGFKKTALFSVGKIKMGWQALALPILFFNFFRPMYGQSGPTALILSISTHFWQILSRLVFMLFWLFLWIFVIFFWLALPLLIIWQLAL